MEGIRKLTVLIILTPFLVNNCCGQAVITFIDTNYVVQEGDMFTVQLMKTGTAASPVNVVVEVSLND